MGGLFALEEDLVRIGDTVTEGKSSIEARGKQEWEWEDPDTQKYSSFGFHFVLEAPTSSSVRREDDTVTYVNKGQFYGVTLDYQPDPDRPHLKSQTVKSVIMLVFRW